MNKEKVVFSFFMVLALTLNFGFYIGEVANPAHHNVYELFAVVIVNLIATILKFGDRSQMGAMLLATSLVALVQLISASVVWTFATQINGTGLTPNIMATIVALSGGAMVANIISVVLLMIETAMMRH
jgi:Ca2+/H+ antiporter, TMEM165/GDT1 family